MFNISPASTVHLTLAEVVQRLSQNEVVRGVVIMGSVAKNQSHPNSDYDVLVILNNEVVPVHLVNTVVDGHLAEFYFTHEHTLDELLTTEKLAIADNNMLANYVRYISSGQIVFDPSGKLARINQLAKDNDWFQPQMWLDSDIYHEWFRANYNIQQNRRYLAASASNPDYAMALQFRLLYAVFDTLTAYHRVRKLPWRGEKEMSRYLAQHEPEFLETYRQYFAETNLIRKMALYEKLATVALAPLGPLWPSDSTAIEFNDETEVDVDLVDAGLNFWESLISED